MKKVFKVAHMRGKQKILNKKQEAKEMFKDMMDDYNIANFYRMSKFPLKIVLTLILPFVLFGWLFWLMMSGIAYLMEYGLKDD